MFFNISKILLFLTDPLFYIILFSFFGALQFRKRKLALLLFIVIYLASMPVVSQRLMYFLEHMEKPSFSSTIEYDTVVVLSGMVNLAMSEGDKIEFSGAVDRILKGIELVKDKKADHLLISGGTGSLLQDEASEAVLLGEFSKKLGVPEQLILLDQTSRNTYQNAVNTREILKKHELKQVLLVTSAFHMFRSNGCFKRVGITADLLPVDFSAAPSVSDFRDFLPSSGALRQNYVFFHELIGILVYGISGKAKYF